jgi:hypothetical protein
VQAMDIMRRLIERAYPELQILADCDGHGRGRELHVADGRGCQALVRDEADLFRWFGTRGAKAAEPAKLPETPVGGAGRKQLALF